jgi:SAM-dependent methyltransferase
MPTSDVLHELYERYSYDTNHLGNLPEFVLRSLAKLLQSFAPYRNLNRLLDVGFGAGAILLAAQRDGWEVHGLEKSRLAVEQAQARGFARAREGDFLAPPYEERSFDVITLAGVVEHLVDPQPFLRQARRLLRSGGVLFLSTPNSRSLSSHALGLEWSVVSPPEHLHLFSKASVKLALQGADFREPLIRTEGFNPYDVVSGWRRKRPSRRKERAGGGSEDPPRAMSRVESAYAINGLLMGSSVGRGLKELANRALTLAFLGDELKVWARAD